MHHHIVWNTSSDELLYIVAPGDIDGFSDIYSKTSMMFNKGIEWASYVIRLSFLLSIVGLIAFVVPEENTTSTTKTCSDCGKIVPFSSKAGSSCPHCGVYFSRKIKKQGKDVKI